MRQHILILILSVLPVLVVSQNKIANGYVLDKQSKAPIDSAIVAVYDTAIYTYTDVTGYFSVQTPRRRRHLDISHTDYESKRILLGPGYQQRSTMIYLRSKVLVDQEARMKKMQDSTVLNSKNVISLSLVEIFAVAIAVRYERFLRLKHSAGIHASWYVYGHNSSFGSEYNLYANYNGFKAVPFYRFYPVRKAKIGLFVEGKIPFGYFNFSDYEYHYHSSDNQKLSYEYSFGTWGAGISVGVMLGGSKPTGDDNRRWKPTFNISVGYQYFPMVEPPKYIYREVNPETTLRYYTTTDWWYMPGPGSVFDLKITIGRVF